MNDRRGRRRALWLAAVVAVVAATPLAVLMPAGAGEPAVVQVIKQVGPGAPGDASFTVTVACDGLEPQFLIFGVSSGTQLAQVPTTFEGSCTFTETQTGGGTPSYACSAPGGSSSCQAADGPDPAVVTFSNPGPGVAAGIVVTNTFAPDLGSGTDPAAEALVSAPSFTG